MDPNYDLLFAVPDTDENKDFHKDSAFSSQVNEDKLLRALP